MTTDDGYARPGTSRPVLASGTAHEEGGGSTLHAWIDESMQYLTGSGGLYVLAAVVADPARCDQDRDQLAAIKPKGATKLHWRDESPVRQRKIAAMIADIDVHATVVVGTRMNQAKQERARSQCLQRLLVELDQQGVSQAWIETRTVSLNRKDAATVDHMRGSRSLSRGLRVDVQDPGIEPMLWIPDAVAGAVGASLRGADDYLQIMAQVVDTIEITLR
jgi:hypothetical protein